MLACLIKTLVLVSGRVCVWSWQWKRVGYSLLYRSIVRDIWHARMHGEDVYRMISTTMADSCREDEHHAESAEDARRQRLRATLGEIAGHVYADFRRVREAFNDFDRDGTRQISAEELQKAMRRGGFDLSSEDVAEIFELFDCDVTGKLSYRCA